MPTRIPPYRAGYGDNPGPAEPGDAPNGYFCQGILRPCIEPMDGTEFECLPKSVCGLMTDVPYYDLTTLRDDLELGATLDTCDERFDPQDGSLRIDLWNALRRAGLDDGIDTGCTFPYISNANEPASEGDFPIESESTLQVKYCPGYMDPIVIPFPSVGDGSEVDEEIPSESSGASGESSGEEAEFEHPFKTRVKPGAGNIIEVGYLRPRFNDHIVVMDQTTDQASVINFPDPEEITMDGTAYYIYYDIYKDTGQTGSGGWVADLEKSTTWPPPNGTAGDENTHTGNIIRLIGHADTFDGLNYVWQQHMYENPTEQQIDPRGQFEAWYIDDGYVWINDGSVACFEGSGDVTGGAFALGSPLDIWVEVVSTHGEATSVSVTTSLQSGTYPGLVDFVDCSTTNFNFLIGSISGNTYVPGHKGRLDIDTTLFMYDGGSTLEEFMLWECTGDGGVGGSDEPRLMMFSDDSTSPHQYDVGLDTNDQLYHGYSFGLDIEGGAIQSLDSEQEYNWYGKNVDGGPDDFFDISGVNGTALSDNAEEGSGSVSLLSQSMEWDFDYGLCQDFPETNFDDSDFPVTIEAGDNIWIEYSAGAAAVGEGEPTPASAKIHGRGGWTDGPTTKQLIAVDGTAGTAYGTGEASVTSNAFTWDIAYGHVVNDPPGLKIDNGTEKFILKAGENVQIDYEKVGDVGTATIKAKGEVPCVEDSLEYDASTGCLQFVNDEQDPGAWKFYGTDSGGLKADKGYKQASYVDVITSIQLNPSTNILEFKKTQFRVFDIQPEDASFTPVPNWAVTACP